jgi:hypothetical protein
MAALNSAAALEAAEFGGAAPAAGADVATGIWAAAPTAPQSHAISSHPPGERRCKLTR